MPRGHSFAVVSAAMQARRVASQSRRRVLQGALALPALSGCDWWFGRGAQAGSTDYAATIADGRAAIRAAMQATDTSSVSVALMDADTIVWEEAFGVVDRSTDVAATPDTLYNIGSVSKVLVTLAVMQLVDRGRVGLDVPVVQYLPQFRMLSPGFAQITVRMLLNHASGLPGTTARDIFMFAPRPGYALQVEQTQANLHLKAEPGAFSVYCNDGFSLAERVVAEVSGRSYPQYVQEEIFGPLGMTRSRFALEPLAEGSFAHSYVGGTRQGQEFVLAYGTGGAVSTPRDMMRLASMFINEGRHQGVQVVSAAAVRQMATSQVSGQPLFVYPGLMFGLGWDTVAQAGMAEVGITCWQKNGGTALYGSDFFVLPRERLALMITGTSTAYDAGKLAERILLHALAENGAIPAVPSPITQFATRPAPVQVAELEAMVGVYGASTALYRLAREGDEALTLFTWREGSWAVLEEGLRRRSDGSYANDKTPPSAFRVATVAGIDFLQVTVTHGYGHYPFLLPLAQRLAPREPLPAAWQRRLGQTWLLVNENVASVLLAFDPPTVTLGAAPELPGYVLIDDVQPAAPDGDDRTRMVLTIPMNGGRDLREVVATQRDGATWLWLNGQWFMPIEAAVTLVPGSNGLALGAEGYTVWGRVPAGARLQVRGGQSGWRLYDATWASVANGEGDGEASLPPTTTGYLAVFGDPGASVSVTVA